MVMTSKAFCIMGLLCLQFAMATQVEKRWWVLGFFQVGLGHFPSQQWIFELKHHRIRRIDVAHDPMIQWASLSTCFNPHVLFTVHISMLHPP